MENGKMKENQNKKNFPRKPRDPWAALDEENLIIDLLNKDNPSFIQYNSI